MDGSHALIVVLLIVIILLLWKHHKSTKQAACASAPAAPSKPVPAADGGTAESFNPAVWYSGSSTYASTLGRRQGMANAGATDYFTGNNPGVGTNWSNYMNRTVLPN